MTDAVGPGNAHLAPLLRSANEMFERFGTTAGLVKILFNP
jgi:hypothetical protein